ncbi:peptidoglycan-binding protein [Myxococcus sp. 1LA]
MGAPAREPSSGIIPLGSPSPRTIPSGGVLHEVQQGENVESIAFLYGHLPDPLWKHERNAALRAQRDSRGVLHPGDTLFIPPLKHRTVTVRTGATHRFVVRGVRSRLRFRARINGLPLAEQPYVLEVGSLTTEGLTDSDGGVDCPLRPDAPRALLRIGHAPFVHTYELDLRALDPVAEPSGLRQRLSNLGYLSVGEAVTDEALQTAVRGFQAGHGLEPTGTADTRTRELLRQAHGS